MADGSRVKEGLRFWSNSRRTKPVSGAGSLTAAVVYFYERRHHCDRRSPTHPAAHRSQASSHQREPPFGFKVLFGILGSDSLLRGNLEVTITGVSVAAEPEAVRPLLAVWLFVHGVLLSPLLGRCGTGL